MKKFLIKKTKRKGRGIFSNKRFKKGDLLFVWKGPLVISPYIPGEGNNLGKTWVGYGENIWIKTSPKNYGAYTNHSCNPNAGLVKRNMRALSDIAVGDEITMDYSSTETDPYFKMRCRCGERNCRKLIGPVDALPLKSYRKIFPYLPRFVITRFKRLHKL